MTVLKTAAVALGLTMVYQFRIDEPLVDPKHLAVFHWSGSMAALYLPVLLDAFVFWALVLGLLLMAERCRSLHTPVWLLILLFTPWIVLKDVAALTPGVNLHRTSSILFCCAGAAYVLLLAFWQPNFANLTKRSIDLASTSFSFGALGATLLLLEMGAGAWQARALNTPPSLMPLTEGSNHYPPAHGRILWIIFDELSYQQVYEHRSPGLQLPAFDALAAQSTIFTQVRPAGIHTERIVPALLSGHAVQDISATAEGHLRTRTARNDAWRNFEPRDTVFADALQAGYQTGVAGWYNPYCRVLAPVLNRCTWEYGAPLESGMAPANSLLTNMLRPLTVVASSDRGSNPIASLFGSASSNTANGKSHIDDYRELLAASEQLLDSPDIGFVFLHLPVPHPNGIYNRRTGQLTSVGSNYMDNLALADACLAQIRARLEKSNRWDSSTVIVMGDHGWRTKLLWADAAEWTPEEEVASNGGEFDERPAYLVKLPYQQTPVVHSAPFSAIRTRELLYSLMHGTPLSGMR